MDSSSGDELVELHPDGTSQTFDINTQPGQSSFPGADGGFANVPEAPCYCRGTLIRTERGENRVERLKIGDKVMTAAGVPRPIKWIGQRSYAGRFIKGNKDALPIRVSAGALDDNAPKRDLWLSPHHALYFKDAAIGGVLIEAKILVNGVSIVQSEHVKKVQYFHIELETHDVLIAEGTLAESFIDDNSRFTFHNADEYRTLYPEAAIEVAQYCAPRLRGRLRGRDRAAAHCATCGPAARRRRAADRQARGLRR